MKSLTNCIRVLLLSSLAGCGQQLVEFIDASANEDLAVRGDLAAKDLSANGDLAGGDLSASTDLAGIDLAATGVDLAGSNPGDGGFGNDGSSLQPMVIAVTPLDGAMNVATFKRPTATFNKAMDPASINVLSFTLQEMGTLQHVSGTVSYTAINATATFKPANPLIINTTYRATITTAAMDTMGNQLAADYVWTFTTSAMMCPNPPISLGSAGNFGVIAETTITNSGPTVINGDIAVSPGPAPAIVGFGAGSGTVNGSQYSPPSPMAAQAVADMETAFLDGANRDKCFVLIDAELGSKTLAPGLYRSNMSSFAISDGLKLTLDAQGDPDAVFIIQTSTSTLKFGNGSQVILAGGAKATNVFWSVGTQTIIGTTAVIKGTILSGTSISMLDGSVVEGRALAKAAVTLLRNTISIPAP